MQIGGRQDHDELFAAIAADEILGANAAHKECAGLAQDRIASFMAIGIVEILEVIQIEHEDAKTLFCADGAADFALKYFLQVAPIV
jgi:hypothetical protein